MSRDVSQEGIDASLLLYHAFILQVIQILLMNSNSAAVPHPELIITCKIFVFSARNMLSLLAQDLQGGNI